MKKIIIAFTIALALIVIIYRFEHLENKNRQLQNQINQIQKQIKEVDKTYNIEIGKVNGRVDSHLKEIVDIEQVLHHQLGDDWKAY